MNWKIFIRQFFFYLKLLEFVLFLSVLTRILFLLLYIILTFSCALFPCKKKKSLKCIFHGCSFLRMWTWIHLPRFWQAFGRFINKYWFSAAAAAAHKPLKLEPQEFYIARMWFVICDMLLIWKEQALWLNMCK